MSFINKEIPEFHIITSLIISSETAGICAGTYTKNTDMSMAIATSYYKLWNTLL